MRTSAHIERVSVPGVHGKSGAAASGFPEIGKFLDELHVLRAKVAFMRTSMAVATLEQEGVFRCVDEVLDGMELAANDLDVIGESMFER